MKYAAFDLEISKVIPERWYADDGEYINGPFASEAEATQPGADWRIFQEAIDLDDERPLGISCAGIKAIGRGHQNWYSMDEDGNYRDAMTWEDAEKLVRYLGKLVGMGYTLVGFNSLSFDFQTLAEESGLWGECAELAMGHVDIMFQFFCQLGYCVGLEALAQGAGLGGKTEDVDGKKAPGLWRDGEYQKVLDYCEQDVKLTYNLALVLERDQRYKWTSRRGNEMDVLMAGGRLLTVRQALELAEPDTSWMDRPRQRAEFMAWMEKVNAF